MRKVECCLCGAEVEVEEAVSRSASPNFFCQKCRAEWEAKWRTKRRSFDEY